MPFTRGVDETEPLVLEGQSAPISHAQAGADRTTLRRMDLVGRLTLYNATLFLAMAPVIAIATVVWILPPLTDNRAARWTLAWCAIAALVVGIVQAFLMFGLFNLLVPKRAAAYEPLAQARVHVAITSYNDEPAVAATVCAFKAIPAVHKVFVADNMSTDGSAAAARSAGADGVVLEPKPGYGACCAAALKAAAAGLDDRDVVILVEGDCTFSPLGVYKFLPYLEHCDLVLGTRTTQELRETETQMDWLINPGNQVVAKLTQLRFWGVRLSDVGCTYRALRVRAYRQLAPLVRDRRNLYGYEMLLAALQQRMRLIEVPVMFRARVGQSKGVGANKIRAARLALRMLWKLYTC